MSSSPTSLDQLTQYPLLTPAEEISCGRAVQERMAILAVNPDGPYTKEERRTLRVGLKGRDRLVTGNLRWAFTMSRKFLPAANSLTFDDLVQEAALGLIRAAEKFDPARGYKFSTYSFWWLRQGINKGLHADRMIRLPSNAVDAQRKIWRFKDSFLLEEGRYPTIPEIAKECKLSVDSTRLFIQHAYNAASLDSRVLSVESESSSVGDLIACDRETPEDFVERLEMLEWLEVLLGKIEGQHRESVINFYGLTGPPQSFSAQAAAAVNKNTKEGHTQWDALRKRLSTGHAQAMAKLREAVDA